MDKVKLEMMPKKQIWVSLGTFWNTKPRSVDFVSFHSC